MLNSSAAECQGLHYAKHFPFSRQLLLSGINGAVGTRGWKCTSSGSEVEKFRWKLSRGSQSHILSVLHVPFSKGQVFVLQASSWSRVKHLPCADTCFVCLLPAVAEEPRPAARKTDSLWRHGVLLVYHSTGDHLWLVVSTRSSGPSAL